MIDNLLLLKFVKFCVVGLSGMGVDFGTTWILKEKVRINKYIANSTGFILAATSNYVWNRVWTFQINFYISKLFAVGVVTLWNFLMNYLITFR